MEYLVTLVTVVEAEDIFDAIEKVLELSAKDLDVESVEEY